MSLPPVFTNRCCKLVSDQFSIYRDCPRKRHVVLCTMLERFPKLDVAGSSPVSRSNNPFELCALGASTVTRRHARDS